MYKNSINGITKGLKKRCSKDPWLCNFCGEKFLIKDRLMDHKWQVHAIDRPYECQVCGKGFRQMGHLSHHMSSHSEARPFPCSYCGKTFKHRHNANRHISSNHANQ